MLSKASLNCWPTVAKPMVSVTQPRRLDQHHVVEKEGEKEQKKKKIRNKTAIQMENSKFNGFFILICRQQHFENISFQMERTIAYIYEPEHTIQSVSIFLFLYICRKESPTHLLVAASENLNRFLRMCRYECFILKTQMEEREKKQN